MNENEIKILFNNIRNFRQMLNENVDDNDIKKYIDNHEYIYIFYTGDENNKRGYRTIRPYVLGVSKAGNKVIRAWQDRGKSVSMMTGKRGNEHDYWVDEDGRKAGWRMFRLDRIEKIYPTGKRFHKTDGTVMIPPKYKEGSDKDMTSIIAYVSTNKEPDIEVTKDKDIKTDYKKSKWDDFKNGNKNNREITADDVIKLKNIASNVYKKRIGSFLVAIKNNNDFDIININDKHKIPDNAVIGTLTNLYDRLVKQNAPVDTRFFNDELNNIQNEIKNDAIKKQNEKMSTIPNEKKTFFKK